MEISAETVVYVGSSEKALSGIVRQWGNYAKRRVVRYDSLEEYAHSGQGEPVLLCVAGSEISTDEEVSVLRTLADEGQAIVFCDLPEPAVLRNLPELGSLLGIQEIVQENVELTGIKLFSGFLLGGEVIYRPTNADEEKMQDLTLSVPWYLTLRGTKTYMVGLLEDEQIENGELPGLIWRNSYGDARIFAVNGTYMYDQTGLGILSAILYELREYELYPVVNAQNLSVANFPNFAPENIEAMGKIYARSLRRLQMDLIWPNLIASANKGNYQMTCFLAPRLDYTASGSQQTDDLTFYLRQFREQGAEAGLSLDHLPEVTLEEKLAADQEFFSSSNANSYSFSAAYVGNGGMEAFLAVDPQRILRDVRTVTGNWEDADLLFYCTDTIVAQSVTADGFFHTYSQDLRVRAIETALAYSNILLDMKRVSWPGEDEPHWEVLSERYSSNINTYWNPFDAFEKATVTKSDERVRAFLAMDYADSRNGDTITVDIGHRNGDVWFLLRTHSESVRSITGGTYQQVEQGVYLICAQEDHLEIRVESDARLIYSLS